MLGTGRMLGVSVLSMKHASLLRDERVLNSSLSLILRQIIVLLVDYIMLLLMRGDQTLMCS